MARGKHRTRADGRRNAQQDAVLRQLEAELASEQQALAEAEHALAEVRQLQSDVEQERNALAEEVAPIAEELRSERDFLRSVLADAGRTTPRSTTPGRSSAVPRSTPHPARRVSNASRCSAGRSHARLG